MIAEAELPRVELDDPLQQLRYLAAAFDGIDVAAHGEQFRRAAVEARLEDLQRRNYCCLLSCLVDVDRIDSGVTGDRRR